MAESRFQGKVKKWLKDRGCFVLIMSAVPGVPDGCPDVVALCPSGRWVTLECKTHEKAKFRPLQLPTIAKLSKMGYSRATYPENWGEVRLELEQII